MEDLSSKLVNKSIFTPVDPDLSKLTGLASLPREHKNNEDRARAHFELTFIHLEC